MPARCSRSPSGDLRSEKSTRLACPDPVSLGLVERKRGPRRQAGLLVGSGPPDDVSEREQGVCTNVRSVRPICDRHRLACEPLALGNGPGSRTDARAGQAPEDLDLGVVRIPPARRLGGEHVRLLIPSQAVQSRGEVDGEPGKIPLLAEGLEPPVAVAEVRLSCGDVAGKELYLPRMQPL